MARKRGRATIITWRISKLKSCKTTAGRFQAVVNFLFCNRVFTEKRRWNKIWRVCRRTASVILTI